ncbi:restriction endonuclease subunit S [Aeromonas caviae]|uniref:restriction endonuclease subunit S n=1 Tax=Aeromonas TaxID=642 RepID=UPI00259EF8CF|nr:restriction endonuclease subunit S [Aeromonas hydrophila]MDM5116965.1 restriction endonuclease subunit S [Aeromonas hydrophila]
MSEVVANSPQGLTGKYKQYPEYKDSGVEWVGDMPRHWQSKPAFAVVMDECIKNSDGAESNVLSLSYGNIVERDVETNFGLLPESFNTYQIVNPGDIILRLTDLQNDKRSLRVGRSTLQGIITSAYLKLSCSGELNDRYAYRLLHSYDTTKVFYGMGGGLRQSMKFEDFRRLPFLVPPLEEQRTIAAFLDYETARIDRLIAQQQRLIELLKEKRQAVISHAVTKGLNPDVPMKDSGVEWLGQVPEHWVVTNLKYVFDSLDYRRIPLSAEQRGERQGDYPYYGASGVIDGVDDYLFDEECVLVGEDGANLIMRSTPLAFVVSGKYWVNNHAHILRMHDGLNRYWAAVINNVDIKPIVSGSAQPKLTAEALGNIKVAFPQDTTEREELLIHINAETPKFDELIGHANQQVILLKERRSALISAAVTGKIDLRGWTPPAEEVAA